ncbi:MAG: sulfatase [Candidatus Dadabacteria bacterium]|nr:MAG: sulfatase [Candidatus Dadabacteria bacterium]
MKLLRAALVVAIAAALAWGALKLAGPSGPRIDPRAFEDGDHQPAEVASLFAKRPGAPRPNLVLILADDLGYGDLARYGTRAIRTPNLDRLADEGARFTQFYSSAPICSPSRAGLLTGRYPVRTGVSYIIFASDISLGQRINLALVRATTRLGMGDFHDSIVPGLPDSEVTLAEALKAAGYVTGMVGKWHLGDFSHDRRYLPTRHGFDFFEGMPHSNDEMPVAYFRNEQEITPNIGLDQDHLTADLTRAAVGFIERNAERPFFLYVAHKDVHLPFFPSERFRGKSAAGLYGDAAEELDWSVGEILSALDRLGLTERTLVAFTSDNGPWYEGNTQGLRGRKGMSFEGSMRVPLLVRWPGHIAAGLRIDAPAMNIDIFPTFLWLAGLEGPRDRVIDGRSLWPLLSGQTVESPHEVLFFFHDREIEAARSGRWKYYRKTNRYYWPVPMDDPSTIPGRRVAAYVYTDERTGRSAHLLPTFPLLYDLEVDPSESYNVIDRHQDVARKLADAIHRMEAQLADNPRGWR